MLENVGKCWKMLENVGNMLENVGNVGKCLIVMMERRLLTEKSGQRKGKVEEVGGAGLQLEELEVGSWKVAKSWKNWKSWKMLEKLSIPRERILINKRWRRKLE